MLPTCSGVLKSGVSPSGLASEGCSDPLLPRSRRTLNYVRREHLLLNLAASRRIKGLEVTLCFRARGLLGSLGLTA